MTLAILLLAGCSDFALKQDNELAAPTEDDGALFPDTPFRVDVFPSASLGGGRLADQSFWVELDGSAPVDLELEESVSLSGTISGFASNTTAEVSVPGGDEGIDAFFQAFVPDTPMGTTVATESGGRFDATLVPNADYVLAWIPQDDVDLPLLVESGVRVDAGSEVSRYIDFGVPLYGSLSVGDGTIPSSALVQLVDPETGVGGPVKAASSGSYHLRALPGAWELHVFSESARYLPEQVIPVVVPDDEDGLRQDLFWETLDLQLVFGEIRDSNGNLLENVRVRFTSESIDGSPAASLQVEADSDSNGLYQARLVPGTYQVEYIPPYGSSVGPAIGDEVVVGSQSQDLATVELSPRPTVQTILLDPWSRPVSGGLVRAQELAYDGYVYEATTGDDGFFVLPVSDTELTWTFIPGDETDAAITVIEASPWSLLDLEEIQLEEGELVSGSASWEGEPAAFSPVEILDEDERLVASTITDADGAFELRVVLP